MPARTVRVIKTSAGKIAGKAYDRLRVVVNLRREHQERLGWAEGTEIEMTDHPDGLLLHAADITPRGTRPRGPKPVPEIARTDALEDLRAFVDAITEAGELAPATAATLKRKIERLNGD